MGGYGFRLIGALLSALVASGPATAQVIEIGTDGTTRMIAGPAVFDGSAPRAIAMRGRDLHPDFANASAASGLDPLLIRAVAWTESRFRPGALSPKGALGLMQLMPATAAELRVNAADPAENLAGGARYLRMLYDRYGDIRLALAAYNAGPRRVDRAGGIPAIAETRDYVERVLAEWARLGEGTE